MPQSVATLLDGGFVKKKLRAKLNRFPEPADIVTLCRTQIMQKPRLEACEVFRIYYYDAPPLDGIAVNPIDRTEVDFSKTSASSRNRALIDRLELEPDFAVRRGFLDHSGWKLGSAALKRLSRSGGGEVSANDLVPDISQKGVDIRIGPDIASLALKRTVEILVLVTGDSDFVPPMKFASKEGVRVYLESLGHGVRRELKAHADYVL